MATRCKDVWVNLDDVNPESDPPFHGRWLPIEGTGEIAHKVVNGVRSPLELGVNASGEAKENA